MLANDEALCETLGMPLINGSGWLFFHDRLP